MLMGRIAPLRPWPEVPEVQQACLRHGYAATHFALVPERKADTFPRGSASLTGAGPGLQNRWRALRGVLGGFDSHALPPLTNLEREQGVAPRRGSGRSGPGILGRHR